MSRRAPRYHLAPKREPKTIRCKKRKSRGQLKKGREEFDTSSEYLVGYDYQVFIKRAYETREQHRELIDFVRRMCDRYKIVVDKKTSEWYATTVVQYVKMTEDDYDIFSLCHGDKIYRVVKRRESQPQ